MKIRVKISTKKPKFGFEWDPTEKVLLIDVKSSPKKGEANKEIIKELKKFFQSEVRIKTGFESKEKILEIFSRKKEILEKIES